MLKFDALFSCELMTNEQIIFKVCKYKILKHWSLEKREILLLFL